MALQMKPVRTNELRHGCLYGQQPSQQLSLDRTGSKFCPSLSPLVVECFEGRARCRSGLHAFAGPRGAACPACCWLVLISENRTSSAFSISAAAHQSTHAPCVGRGVNRGSSARSRGARCSPSGRRSLARFRLSSSQCQPLQDVRPQPRPTVGPAQPIPRILRPCLGSAGANPAPQPRA